ncbi:uncharacterized protein FSUBG_5929 [Fusarium subglutinans]|uniref:Uncharacterized protein n=1 Tax=Gibberella subglutinans TaxID=42677 RepID=A0A8H5Q1Y1_GIBSU|nr:uncharacterized protein FSUBG_5929 [Fusarium subglutinans]KAF5606532.1 hypothetical protein FSUBG_5929 [Fusarium subglutinans]
MPKRRLPSDSVDDAPRKIRKASTQQMEHHGNLIETISSLQRCSLSQPSNEVEPGTQLLTPDRIMRPINDQSTNLDEHSRSARTHTDNGAKESSDDSDMEESLKSPRPESLQEMSDEIKKLNRIIKVKARVLKYWRDSTMCLEKEVEDLKAKLGAVNKESARTRRLRFRKMYGAL